jgi:hypothetical protein
MKKLIIIFSVLFLLTFLAYLGYNFVSTELNNLGFNWNSKSIWHGFNENNLSRNIYVFKDSYTSTCTIHNINLNLTGIKVKLSSYDGEKLKYKVTIESNFNMKLDRQINGDTLTLKTFYDKSQDHKIREAQLDIQVPKSMGILNLNLTGGSFDVNDCDFQQASFNLTGGELNVNDTKIDNSIINLTGGVFKSNSSILDSVRSYFTGCDVNVSNLQNDDLHMQLTGGKISMDFEKYNNMTLNITGGSAKFYGINQDSKVQAEISVGYVDFFGEKHIKDFQKDGKNGNIKIDLTAGKLDFE